jgi:hypothetical protein
VISRPVARYSLTLRVAKLRECPNPFAFTDHLEQVFDWADTPIFDVGAGGSGSGLRAWANWNSETPGAIDDFDPVAADPAQRQHRRRCHDRDQPGTDGRNVAARTASGCWCPGRRTARCASSRTAAIRRPF